MFLNGNLKEPFAESYTTIIDKNSLLNKMITFVRNQNAPLFSKIAKDKIFLSDSEIAQGIVAPQDFLNKKNKNILGNEFEIGESVFALTDEKIHSLNLLKKEVDDLIKPLYSSTEISRYYANKKNKNWIIYTSSKFKNPNEIIDYPNIKQHLDKFASIITSDNKPYGLHRSRAEKFFKGEKIISLRKCAYPAFSYVNFDCYVLQTFFVLKTDNLNLKYLTGLLNSRLAAFWLRHKGKMQGDNYQVDKEPLLSNDRQLIELFDRLHRYGEIFPISLSWNYRQANAFGKVKSIYCS